MARLRRDQIMIAKEMVAHEVSVRQVARRLGVDESSLRYRLGRAADVRDGRRKRASMLDGWDARVAAVLARLDDPRVRREGVAVGAEAVEATVFQSILQREYGSTGRFQAVRRYLQRRFTVPEQAVRRVETPPGAKRSTIGSSGRRPWGAWCSPCTC